MKTPTVMIRFAESGDSFVLVDTGLPLLSLGKAAAVAAGGTVPALAEA